MPLYEYYCKDCRGKFELLTTYTESEVDIECAKCHGPNVRKLVSVFARPRSTRSASSDFASDFGGDADYGDEGDDGEMGGHCCGGSCGCHD